MAGFALRAATIDSKGFWLDEAITVAHANRTFPEVFVAQVGNVHPPLFHLLAHAWMTVFGLSEVAIRSFSLVFGVATIPLAYWAGRTVYNRRTGVIAAIIVAFSPYAIWYSQEARMYAMLMFFGFLGFTLLVVAMRRNTKVLWLAYGLATFAGLFTHYFYAFLVMGEVVGVIAVAWRRRREARRTGKADSSRWFLTRLVRDVPSLLPWFVTSAVMAVVYGLWVFRSVLFFPGENALISSATGSGLGYGQTPPELAWRLNDFGMVIAQMTGGFHPEWAMFALVAMWPLVVSLMLVMLGSIRRLARSSVLVLCGAGGVLIITALGQWQGQVLASRYFAAVAAPAILAIAAAIAMAPRRSVRLFVAVMIAFSLVAYVDQSLNHGNMMRYDNREAIQVIVEGYRPGDVVIYEPFFLTPLFSYYLPPGIPSHAFPFHGIDGSMRNGKLQLGQDLDRAVGPAPRVWLYLSYQDIETVRGDAYNTRNWFLRNGFTRAWQLDMARVELSLFEATATRTVSPVAGGDR